MPIYEYQCGQCHHSLEAIQKVADAALTECPECGAQALKKRISAPVFRLKGGGWYETDFKTGNKKNLAGEKGADGAKTNTAEKSAGSTEGAAKKPGADAAATAKSSS
ncbi:type I antifreeze protein [Luminiphilus syltensis NOR5-1B]|uniref:Type I antifreeze protein n=1 Tax=Luminiphilus syltensis NOR5-1B TaxID=565045 RepID=B8KS70_9GAMM|nr:zinc ribbon domain-containing protein [Luminiphilus syltensis]EED36992.1 type I antifreeze protein [Luminiphilus syltensis NOR5-1B]